RDTRGLQQYLVRRPFVVEAIALALEADGVDAGRQIGERRGRKSRARRLPIALVGRGNRILRENVQDIGEQKLLMLLLGMQPDLEDARDLCELGVGSTCNEALDRGIDVGAVCADLVAVWPGEEPAPRPRMTRPSRHIVRVEEKGEPLVEDPI